MVGTTGNKTTSQDIANVIIKPDLPSLTTATDGYN